MFNTTFQPILNAYKLIINLNSKLKKRLNILLVLILLSSIADCISIVSILPFLMALSNPKKLLEGNSVFGIAKLNFISELNDEKLIIFFSISYLVIIFIATSVKFLTVKQAAFFCSNAVNFLSVKSYRNYFNQPLEFHLLRESEELINNLTVDMIKISGSLQSLLEIIIGSSLIIFISIILSISNFKITFAILLIIIIYYILIIRQNKKRLKINSKIIHEKNQKIIKLTQENIGNIKEIIIDSNQEYILNNFKNEDFVLRDRVEEIKFMKKIPRILIEFLGLVILGGISIYLVVIQKNKDYIPTIGLIAFTCQKLLSSSQAIYGGWNFLSATNNSMLAILDLMRIDFKETKFISLKPYQFQKSIELKNISFKYKNADNFVLNGINLVIQKGERIGIIGKTGSGKSTLIDIINGLLKPNSGSFLIDNINLYEGDYFKFLKMWQKNISYIPQNVFLSNDSVLQNITFGSNQNKIDQERVIEASKKANLYEEVNKMKNKFNSLVGERGNNLSGGQIQRVGIARGLYRNKSILIFDESNSSLDKKTEASINKMITKLPSYLTIIIISHSLEFLDSCDKVYNLVNGKLKIIDNK